MNKRDEEYLLRKTYENNQLLLENNRMLKQLISALNYYISHSHEENENDFGRNVLANMLSNMIELKGINHSYNK